MPWWRFLESGDDVPEDKAVAEGVTVPLLTLLQDISRQMREMRTDLGREVNDLKVEVQHANAAISTRVKALEDWRIGHDLGAGHPGLDKRLDDLDRSVEQLTRESEAQRVREEDRAKRETRRVALISLAAAVAVAAATAIPLFHLVH